MCCWRSTRSNPAWHLDLQLNESQLSGGVRSAQLRSLVRIAELMFGLAIYAAGAIH